MCYREDFLGLVPHQYLIVGEHIIYKVGAVLAYHTILLS